MAFQLGFPGILQRAVNVASVPHRSPFRYPGGKTWLVPYIQKWISRLPYRPSEFIEPFAGGAIISLSVAFDHLVDQVTMVELDEDVAAVWMTILGEQNDWLAEEIASFEFTHPNVKARLLSIPTTTRERAFQTILRNRVNRGGILAPGAGMLKRGENGKGLASRWYPKTLSKRILDIAQVADRLSFLHCDGLAVLREHSDREDAVFFIDPPYTASAKRAGTRLYRHNNLDHQRLWEIVGGLAGDFLMTYDDAHEVRYMAQQFGFETRIVPMKNTHNSRMNELIIGRSLGWFEG